MTKKKKIIIISAAAAAVVALAVTLIIILGGKAKTYTVTFLDHDGSVLATSEVEEGEAATAPALPTREGYIFKGWDADFKNVRADITVRALYEAITSPTLLITGKEVVSGEKFTLEVRLDGNTGIVGLLFSLKYDAAALRLESATAGEALRELDLTLPGTFGSGCSFGFDGVEATEGEGVVLTLSFTATGSAGSYPVELSVIEAYDGDVQPISFKTSGNAVIIK